MTVKEALDQIKQNKAEAEQIRQESKSAGTWGKSAAEIANIESRGATAVKQLDVQKKKEDEKASSVSIDSAQIKRDRTQKALDDYMNSDAKKQQQKAADEQYRRDQIMRQLTTGIIDTPAPVMQEDPVEKRLRAEAQEAEAAYQYQEQQRQESAGRSGLFADGYDFGDVTKTILGVNEDTASLKDLTWNSIKRGYYNSLYGEESFKAMNGDQNEKEAIGKILSGDEYQFTPGNDAATAVSGFMGQLGQQARQYTNPRTLAFVGSAAGAAALAGNAGPQALVPEEVITVPAAATAAFAAGSAASNLEIEAGLAYNEMLDAGVSEETARKVAWVVGSGNAGLELIQLDELLDAYKVTKASGATKTFAKKIFDELVDRGVDVGKEVLQEDAQELVTIGGIQFASKHDNGEYAYTADEVKDRLKDTTKSSALTFGLMNVPAAARNTASIVSEQKNLNSAGGKAQGADALSQTTPRTETQTEQTQKTAQQPQTTPQTEQASQPEQSPVQQKKATQEEKQDANLLNSTVEKMRQTGKQTATNAIAESILSDSDALQQLQAQTGAEVKGTKAEKRKAVKDALNQLANISNTDVQQSTATQKVEETAQPKTEEQERKEILERVFSVVKPKKVTNIAATSSDVNASKTEAQESLERIMSFIRPKAGSQQTAQTAEPGSVGAAKSAFPHEVKTSAVYANTFANANTEDLRNIGAAAREADPNISQYDTISEAESLNEARLRTETAQDRYVEHRQLMAKDGWSGADNDTAMRLLATYRKEGKGDRFRELARKQREVTTNAAQEIQSFAKYSREDATVAVKDAVEVLDKMSISEVPKKFWQSNKTDNSRHANVGDADNYSETAASTMSNTQQENTIASKRSMKKESFEAWKTSITNSMLEIANDIENVQDGDVEAMRGIVRQLAQFRRTTAWFGTQNRLTKNADRILKKMDFDTAKTIAKAQLAMIPDDFRKRSAGEVAKTMRIHNMLSALTTTNRNTIGNASMGLMDALSDSTTGRAMDAAMSKFTGIRTVGNDVKYAKEYFTAARDAADMASLCVELNIPWNLNLCTAQATPEHIPPKVGRWAGSYRLTKNI